MEQTGQQKQLKYEGVYKSDVTSQRIVKDSMQSFYHFFKYTRGNRFTCKGKKSSFLVGQLLTTPKHRQKNSVRKLLITKLEVMALRPSACINRKTNLITSHYSLEHVTNMAWVVLI